MNSPTSIGEVGLGSTALGGIFSAFGAGESGAAQKGMYDYQASVAEINSQIALQNADYARQQGEGQAQAFGISAAQRAGQIKVAQASSGLDINSGSAVQVRQSQKLVTDMDLNQIRSNAAKTAYDYDVQSVNFTNQAQIDTFSGQQAELAGDINIGSSIIGTAGSVSAKWLQGNQTDLWNGTALGTA